LNHIFYPCCEVGDRVDMGDYFNPKDKAVCWSCGGTDYRYVMDMQGSYRSNDYRYYVFTYNARWIRPTDEPPPWTF